MDIKDKYILLTGASGGIGQSIAKVLAHHGARLVLVARHQAKLEQLRSSLFQPERHLCIAADLTTPAGIATLTALGNEHKIQGRQFNMVINNAGSNQFQFLAKRSVKSIEQEMRLNLMSPIEITQTALAWLSSPGMVLNIGSTFGAIGYPGYATYCAAKAGVHRFSEAMNRELDGTGIKVLYLAPRATDTQLNSKAVNQLNERLGNHSDKPEVVAAHVINMLTKEKTVKWIGWPESFFARLNQIFPALVSSSIKKQQNVINEYIEKTNHA